jgi:hypothetical protein
VGNPRLDKVAQTIQSKFDSSDDYYSWLKLAIDDIVLREVLPPLAFTYLIGTTHTQWRDDLRYVYTKLSDRAQHAFRIGIASCLKFLNVSEQERASNQPVQDGGKNVEQLALTYIEIVREYKVSEAMRYIPILLETKFPSSRALYDASLLTWRLMPDAEPDVNWIEVFSNPKEARFQPKYSGILALGMCVAQPSQSKYFLTEWEPLRQFLAEIPSSQDERLQKYGRRLFDATKIVLDECDINSNSLVGVRSILNLTYDGIPLELARRLRNVAQEAFSSKKRLLAKVKVYPRGEAARYALQSMSLGDF